MNTRILTAALLSLGCAVSHVPRSNSSAELVRYVERAAKLVEASGASACTSFAEPKWMAGEYYVFVTDAQTNVTVCHPVRADLVGKEQTDLQDSSGKYFIREMMAVAGGPQRRGWVDYTWPRPGESAPATKAAYVIGVTGPDGRQYVVGSGAYGVAH